MKSKPIIMDHFSTVNTSFVLNFDFTNNITIRRYVSVKD